MRTWAFDKSRKLLVGQIKKCVKLVTWTLFQEKERKSIEINWCQRVSYISDIEKRHRRRYYGLHRTREHIDPNLLRTGVVQCAVGAHNIVWIIVCPTFVLNALMTPSIHFVEQNIIPKIHCPNYSNFFIDEFLIWVRFGNLKSEDVNGLRTHTHSQWNLVEHACSFWFLSSFCYQ